MLVHAAIETVASVTDLIKGLRDLSKRSPADRSAAKPAIDCLRAIYFTPDGVITILDDIVAGCGINDDLLQKVLPSFNDREWKVHRSLCDIGFRNTDEMGLSLRNRRLLRDISRNKLSLRDKIQYYLNVPQDKLFAIDRLQVKPLLRWIKKLNKSIEKLEEELI